MRKRTEPRISLARLGEYLCAPTAARRRSIVRDQKQPSSYKPQYYRDARSAIARLLLAHPAPLDDVERAADRIAARARVAVKRPEKQRLANNADVIRAWAQVDEFSLRDATVLLGTRYRGRLSIGGVAVSVAPEVIVLRERGFTNASVGMVLLYISKTTALTIQAGATIAALLYSFVSEHLSEHGTARRQDCLVVDVVAGTAFKAPRAVVKRQKELDAACAEIAGTWGAV